MDIKELKQLWAEEANNYRLAEVGSGVQKFSKKVLSSPKLFDLKEGRLSTHPAMRNREFIEEKGTKAGRTADVIIYIDNDIIVPLEVERYGNIEVGLKQLQNYQTDLQRQYGILTDGYEWRFYNNNVYRSFTIEYMLDNPDEFKTFWHDYTLPVNYYVNFFEPIGQGTLFEIDQLSVEQNRILFFEDITRLIAELKNKFNLVGYLDEENEKHREKKAVEITYAYVIQFILYKTLVDNEFDHYKKLFDQRVKAIKSSLTEQRYKEALVQIQAISNDISRNIYRPFAKEQQIISTRLQQQIDTPINNLDDVAPWLDIFVFIKKYSFNNVRNDIFGFIYENYLKELYEDTKKGQYFTDPAVVNFMLQQLGYSSGKIRERFNGNPDSISIVDPSCGSGTFLYSATHQIAEAFPGNNEQTAEVIEEVVNQNIFGLDIEEFPLYLAEMNILMRMLSYVVGEQYNNPIDKKIKVFWTKDSLAEFLDTGLKNTLSDINIAYDKAGGNPDQTDLFGKFNKVVNKKLDFGYTSYMREVTDLEEMKRSLENHPGATRKRFDFVVGNPPYISYNECSKQSVMFFELLKAKKVQLGDVYGVNLHSVPNSPKKYAPKPNLYAFFLALGIQLLKDGGQLCYIIPQTLLTAGDLDVLRYHLAKYITIEKIIIPDSKMFVGRGIKQTKPVATSSLIIVLKRSKPSRGHKVEIINHIDSTATIEECLDNISQSKKINKKTLSQARLLATYANWNIIRSDDKFIAFYESFLLNSDNLHSYYDHKAAEQIYGDRFYFDGGALIDDAKRTTNPAEAYAIFDYRKNNYKSFSLTTSFDSNYPYAVPLEFAQGSQGAAPYQQKYKIVWRTKDPKTFQYTDKNILLVNNQSLLIASNNQHEIIYLLAILNSKINRTILERLLMIEHEQSFLLSLKGIKEFVRVPVIGPEKQAIKDEVINVTKQLLKLEKVRLADIVDFSNVMQQKFDTATVEGLSLILVRSGQTLKLPIQGLPMAAEIALVDYNLTENPSLESLKSLPIVDQVLKKELVEYTNDLIFSLYFNVKLPELTTNNALNLAAAVKKHKFYSVIHET